MSTAHDHNARIMEKVNVEQRGILIVGIELCGLKELHRAAAMSGNGVGEGKYRQEIHILTDRLLDHESEKMRLIIQLRNE